LIASTHAVQDEGAAEHPGIGPEACGPGGVAHDADGRRSRPRVLGEEGAPPGRGDAEELEVVAAHEAARELFGALRGRVEDVREAAGDHVFKRLDLLLVVEELRELEEGPASSPARLRSRTSRATFLSMWA
jgi:hypothetical protein